MAGLGLALCLSLIVARLTPGRARRSWQRGQRGQYCAYQQSLSLVARPPAMGREVLRGSNPEPSAAGPERLIVAWLFTVAAMVFGMVVLGGLTRLTQSGLSMVEWRPLTGWLPPLSHDAWEAEFRAYQQYPEFIKLNPDMTLAQFEGIYWLEFIHRLWGRLIGVVFLVPFVIFLLRGRIRGRLAAGCVALFVLGGLQGVLGWYMVKSGLVDRPDVSPYRLTAHLTLALLLYAALIWVALDQLRRRGVADTGRLSAAAMATAALVFLTITAGGFVAGTDAGYHFNTFPLMDGRLFPEDAFVLTPLWRNFFETIPLVQFVHRWLAILTLLAIVVFRLTRRVADLSPRGRLAADVLLGWAFVQVGLGIATLLMHMPTALAALHQASAVVLWTLAIWAVFDIRRSSRPLLAQTGQKGDGTWTPGLGPRRGSGARTGGAAPPHGGTARM